MSIKAMEFHSHAYLRVLVDKDLHYLRIVKYTLFHLSRIQLMFVGPPSQFVFHFLDLF
jgi:hypothetical protein